ncbi:MAG: imidazolonepropionase [Deltaproteobacteria bacterium]|nr:imidazolonepropionase [Deltaproteobacteria bacterium]
MNTATLVVGIAELVQPAAKEGDGRSPIEVTRDAALLFAGGIIIAAGPRATVAAHPRAHRAAALDVGGRAVVPGLVDSHTHVLFAGDRIDELARRTRGETYESIARAGGGIARSAAAVRDASVEALVDATLPRIDSMISRGTTTVEAKSGYGLSPEAELKQLRAISALAALRPVDVIATALAHAIPPEFETERQRYVSLFCTEVLEVAAREALARYCDVFVASIAFTPDEARTIAAAARALGLGLRLHVDQLADDGGAALAAELGALAADHLEHTGAAGRTRLAESRVIATLLPGCALFQADALWPDGRALRAAGCEVAVATDCNPGSSMLTDLTLCASVAATRCGLSLEEALWAVTCGGARALGLLDRGRLVPGEIADFVVVDAADWRALLYWPGDSRIWGVFKRGDRIFSGDRRTDEDDA